MMRDWFGIRVSRISCVVAALALCCACLCSCGAAPTSRTYKYVGEKDYLIFLDVEPSSVDPQCIRQNYTVPLNVFDRLVEIEQTDGTNVLRPSLADSWEVSGDGLVYTFHLHEGVLFSNGEQLTADDVKFSFERLIGNPQSKNQELMDDVVGAADLKAGKAESLAGIEVIDDLTLRVTLSTPCAAFLASLSSPAASVLDKETLLESGDEFGNSISRTVGTGPFVLEGWSKGKSITMIANRKHWRGTPKCSGLKMLFHSESDSLQDMYERGEIDILDLDKLGMDAEYFLRGDTYLRNLVRGRRIGITYLTLNESVEPLNNVLVRRALQRGLDREALLQASIGGKGTVENGIFPRGLVGHNQDLPVIPFDPLGARALLEEAGYQNGFDLELCYDSSASQSTRVLIRLAASMWRNIGVRASVRELSPEEFAQKRDDGLLPCYASTFSADYNDPQNLIDPFFGSVQNTTGRSLCYANEGVMERVRQAAAILDADKRIQEYQALEQKIVQEDAAWIPLYSQLHYFVVSDRVEGFNVAWNGWSSCRYDNVSLRSTKA